MSISTENFIKLIYNHNISNTDMIKSSEIALSLDISNAAVTDMSKKLSKQGLIVYEKYKSIYLTDQGINMALNIIRKHRLWETFLHRTLSLNLLEVHKEAENLEHSTSDFLAAKIEEYLENPSFDPHGDPIPKSDGTMFNHFNTVEAINIKENHKYKIINIKTKAQDFFDFCNRNGIKNNAIIEVVKIYKSQQDYELLIDGKTIILNIKYFDLIKIQKL